jgi:hypothetical protein
MGSITIDVIQMEVSNNNRPGKARPLDRGTVKKVVSFIVPCLIPNLNNGRKDYMSKQIRTIYDTNTDPIQPSQVTVSVDLGICIIALENLLKRDYGVDFSFTIMGNGEVLSASNVILGVIKPRF